MVAHVDVLEIIAVQHGRQEQKMLLFVLYVQLAPPKVCFRYKSWSRTLFLTW